MMYPSPPPYIFRNASLKKKISNKPVSFSSYEQQYSDYKEKYDSFRNRPLHPRGKDTLVKGLPSLPATHVSLNNFLATQRNKKNVGCYELRARSNNDKSLVANIIEKTLHQTLV